MPDLPVPMSPEDKRAELREKIEAAEARNEARTLAELARDARDEATGFVKAHPFASVAGALAVGAVIAAILPGPGRRLRQKVTGRGAELAGVVAELGVAYGLQMLEKASEAARDGQDKLEDLGDSIGDGARRVRREAGYMASGASEAARILRREASKKASRAVRDLKTRVTH
ncbi:hypothetical protein [Tsuneonella mangrovi]|uniref:hypothetical protein n=1 Tax=Tsuneonella mangrovi TaxID=1982042 RepID=UPI0012377A5E|nr:hypothetical protein [Tsuneonella mangrovi]